MQGDLFQFPASAAAAASSVRQSFLEKSRVSVRMDQAVIGMIACMILGVVIFCVGVEKGKKIGLREARIHSHSRIAQPAPAASEERDLTGSITLQAVEVTPAAVKVAAETTTAAPVSGVEAAAASENAAGRPAGKYTIQLVTYQNKADAQKHIDRLSAKGYTGFVIPSGKFHQVCANGFEKRPDAVSVLKELKSQKLAPSDAYVRNLPAKSA